MAEPYLSDLRVVVRRARRKLDEEADIVCKHFFSEAAAYVDGRIFMTLTPLGLALKLPESDRAALLGQGGKALRYFPKAPVKRDYVVMPRQATVDADALACWLSHSIGFVLS